MAAEVILRVKVDRSQYNAFKKEVNQGLDVKGTEKVKDSLNGTGEAAKNATTKIQSLGEMLTKKIAWYSISMAISSVTVAFKEALNEIKAVDTQLTNVAKVSGKSMEDLQDLAEKAYSTASKYGVEASQYMEAVYEYTKAGFHDTADVMAELSTKAMLVGDTTAAVADKFLIAANAAWKYGGNVEQLSLLVDKADYINNNYATTFDKIADGFPRVASVASMAGMSAEETMAALGTITATTQETASRAGTALRALILNILKDTTTEVEDGVTTTQEEIDSLRSVLEIYAKDVVKAADATGSLINPMEAIAALSKAYREGALTQPELYQIEQALGGKLRTNQLDALLKNFEETYAKMMNGMANAYGTADKEIETMLGSWEAKTKILKNTWTEFVSKGLDSQYFKDLIDDVTELLDRFGGLNEILPIVAGALASMFAPAIIANLGKVITGFKTIVSLMQALKTGTAIAGGIGGGIGTAISAIIGIATTAYAIYQNHVRKIRQETEKEVEKTIEVAEESRSNFDEVLSLYGTYKTATKGTEEYENAVNRLCEALGVERDRLKDVGGELEYLTEWELKKAMNDSAEAVATAKRAILTEIDTFRGATDNEVLLAGQKRQGTGVTDANGDEVMAYVADEDRLKQSVQAYRIYLQELTALKAAYRSKNYSDLMEQWQSGEIGSGEKLMANEFMKTMTEEQMRKRINEVEGYLDQTAFVKTYIDQLEAHAKYEKAWDDFKNGKITVNELAEAEGDLADAEQAAAAEAAKLEEAQQRTANAFKEVTGQAVSAAEALQKYQDAIDADQIEENADALTNVYKTALEKIDKGLIDSTEVGAAADLLFSTDKIFEYKKANINLADAIRNDEVLNRLYIKGYDEEGNPIFRESVDTAKELIQMFREFDTGANGENGLLEKLVDGEWKSMASIEETDYGLRVIVDDWEMLSNQFGLSEEHLRMLLNLYGLLIPGLEASTADLLEFADAAGAVETAANGIKEVDLAKVIDEAVAQGATTDRVYELVDALQQAQDKGDLKLVIDEEEVTNASEKAQELIGQMDEVTDADHIIDVDDKELTQAVTMADKLRMKLDSIDGKTVTINVLVKGGSGATSEQVAEKVRDFMFASGTDSAPGGAALVNEEGAELIQAGGRAWIAGGGRPTVANLPQGARVWNASQTRAILNNSNLGALFGGIRAMANGGTVPESIARIPYTTHAENAHFGADTSEDETLKALQSMVSLRKSELELLKESGASVAKQEAKQRGIQAALQKEIERLQAIGGSQEEINQLATEWYRIENDLAEAQKQREEEREEKRKQKEQEREEKREKHKQELADNVSLLESELSLLEAQDAPVKDQISKQLEIRKAIQKQINYLEKIGGSQEEINKLKKQQLDIDKDIESREKTLYDNLQTAIENRIEKINKKRDAELEKVDEKIKKLQEEHDLQKETNELKEKELAVEKAQDDLAKAKSQRTVRVFNSATGRWEWTYNASTVNSAKEALKRAKTDLKDYKSEQAYEAKIKKLEDKQATINEKYLKQTEKWQAVLDEMKEPVQTIKQALVDIAENGLKIPPNVASKINDAMGMPTKGVLPLGVTKSLGGTPYGGIGTQYNGNSYTFGNITLSESQARSTTVYELARMAGNLRSYASAM